MKVSLEKNMERAEKGRDFWISLEAENNHKESIYLLFCGEEELERLSLNYMGQLLRARNAEKVVILTCDADSLLLCDVLCKEARVLSISQEEKEELLCFYGLYQFTDSLFILSYERPFGNKLIHLLKNGYTTEQILKDCIFRLRES